MMHTQLAQTSERSPELRHFIAEMNSFFCVLFLVATCGLSVGMIREYSYQELNQGVSWVTAQCYCRYYFKDLATVTTAEEHQRLAEVERISNNPDPGWIGWNKENNKWTWSDEQSLFYLKWKSGCPLVGLADWQKTCVALQNGYLTNTYCNTNYNFYCYRYLILVEESKTWEEALQYCATNYTTLASLPNVTQMHQANLELTLSQTEGVWAGLRFINAQWFWLCGDTVGTPDSLPACPAQPYRCGAFNITTNSWVNRDCNEKRNFICHWG
ncbi:lithostathine-1-beta-like [Tachysurus fulvidraco]|uniref:lithostathine-1-beta-like n=1 Tax=Tachysurus fulvidraco TaxID=1234273 RepID=UPI000F50E66E|nr:lithostathine-1-beta-like [Tachysurus fulvidraco]